MTFENLVEEVKKLSFVEKEELNFLLDKYLVETRRGKIKNSYSKSQKEFKKGKLVFSNNIDKLKELIE
ncbi:hypothetical protein HY745_01170 [Candidatus Desantisbacteria bacterium]|nr:hypothetical protein [Candidatus Desantisbacteria bacterium]